MFVEECCQALLAKLLPKICSKSGVSIEVGCGTFAFYCELFSKLGLKAIAVEPLPVRDLKNICKARGISLVESCLLDFDGFVDIYIGSYSGAENFNLSSVYENWWGASGVTRRVKSISLKSLLEAYQIQEIDCFKIDIEGAELTVIKQFSELEPSYLPKVLVFEYGGGGAFESRAGGWSEIHLDNTIKIIRILKDLGFSTCVKIDSDQTSQESIFDLQSLQPEASLIFSSSNIYGNIVCFHKKIKIKESEVREICKPYQNCNLNTQSTETNKTAANSFFYSLKKIFLNNK